MPDRRRFRALDAVCTSLIHREHGTCTTLWTCRRCQQWVLPQAREPRLPGLLKMLLWAQQRLDERVEYPKVYPMRTLMEICK